MLTDYAGIWYIGPAYYAQIFAYYAFEVTHYAHDQ